MKRLVFGLLVICLAFSCGTAETAKEDVTSESPSRDVYIAEIRKSETSMHSSTLLDKTVAADAIKKYSAFVEIFPGDSLSPDYLFKAAEISTAIEQYPQALKFYERVHTGYPNFELVQESLYLQGYVLDNFMNQDAKAKLIYEDVIKKYPESTYASDAKAAIQNLGKSDEQLIEEFRKKNK